MSRPKDTDALVKRLREPYLPHRLGWPPTGEAADKIEALQAELQRLCESVKEHTARLEKRTHKAEAEVERLRERLAGWRTVDD